MLLSILYISHHDSDDDDKTNFYPKKTLEKKFDFYFSFSFLSTSSTSIYLNVFFKRTRMFFLFSSREEEKYIDKNTLSSS